ncbi:MAG: hypothetical protein JJU11_16415 [Candidatus Sumerlaeia bacterium]|nr:hypothetical protein [Candidatus Sumerlaeia bacterium]
MKPRDIEENLELAQDTLGRWLRFRQFFLMAVEQEEVSSQEEQEFLETTSSIQQNLRKMEQRIEEKNFPFRAKDIKAQIKSAVSISNFRGMNEADRQTFYREWHRNRVYLARTVGGLKFLQEGYRLPEPKKKKKKKGASKMKMAVIAVVVIIALAAAGNFLGLF